MQPIKNRWIVHALEEEGYNVDAVVARHKEFLKATDSVSSLKSFRRMVTKQKNRLVGKEQPASQNYDVTGNGVSMSQQPDGTTKAEGKVVEMKDPEEILKEWGIDTEKWAVEDCRIAQQTIFAKDKKGDLSFKDGRIEDGQISYNGMKTDQIYHVKMKLYRKYLPINSEVVKPVNITIGKNPVRYSKDRINLNQKYRTAVVLGDAQIGFARDERTGVLDPFHDRQALSIATKVIEYVQPDDLIIIGDMIDLTEWSDRFITGPEFERTTQPALNELAWWLGVMKESLDAPEDTNLYFMAGNHEDRLPRAISKNQKSQMGIKRVDNLEGHSVASIPYWLALDELGYIWLGDYPNERLWLNDNLCISHSEKDRTNVNTIINQLMHLEVMGHVHRSFQHVRTIHLRNKIHYAGLVSFGALCRVEEDIVPSKGSRQDWQQGLGVVHYSPDNESNNESNIPPSFEHIFIHSGDAYYRDKHFHGDESIADRLKNDINWTGYK